MIIVSATTVNEFTAAPAIETAETPNKLVPFKVKKPELAHNEVGVTLVIVGVLNAQE